MQACVGKGKTVSAADSAQQMHGNHIHLSRHMSVLIVMLYLTHLLTLKIASKTCPPLAGVRENNATRNHVSVYVGGGGCSQGRLEV
jgi:hypothetical protein